ncbi:unnamed protein product [Peronospora farinosa]|uniref:Uncharacterized protein n=1 Tax=Peronospora farinosa TaxID=134698 RepID=A0ABN8C7J2_9STRA|nr:unnamed protein product [Peronospora farinosa]
MDVALAALNRGVRALFAPDATFLALHSIHSVNVCSINLHLLIGGIYIVFRESRVSRGSATCYWSEAITLEGENAAVGYDITKSTGKVCEECSAELDPASV